MSARSEQLVEEINRLDEQISIAQSVGGDPIALVEKRAQLAEELMRTLSTLSEGKVLKG